MTSTIMTARRFCVVAMAALMLGLAGLAYADGACCDKKDGCCDKDRHAAACASCEKCKNGCKDCCKTAEDCKKCCGEKKAEATKDKA